MIPCSMVRCSEEEGKTALIDQRAVAAGKKWSEKWHKMCKIGSLCVHSIQMALWASFRAKIGAIFREVKILSNCNPDLFVP